MEVHEGEGVPPSMTDGELRNRYVRERRFGVTAMKSSHPTDARERRAKRLRGLKELPV